MNEMTLSRTRPVLPSLLGCFAVCPAKYLLESEAHSYARLPQHPVVILGRVVHKLIDSGKHKEVISGSYTVGQLENDFTISLTASQRAGLVTNWIYNHYGITGLVSRKMLIAQIRYARTLVPSVSKDVILKCERILPVGREIKLTSCRFDMQGRADLIYQDYSGHLKVVDFKTSDVRDEQNEPKAAYLLQIAAYGMMVKELVPDMSIELVLKGISDSWMGMLDHHLIERITSIIRNINEFLPRNVPISVYDLASVGGHCLSCSCRCSCPVYVEKLQGQAQYLYFNTQYCGIDIYGQLLEVESDSHLLTLKILLEDSSIVKVFRIPANVIPDPMKITGKKIALYGLRTFGEPPIGTVPQNFYVINLQDIRNSALQFHLQYEGCG
ncbi:PD-(D/E)XK nuclease family protein [Dickeya dadantii]|uniref:PD-(D/E)XK nuclease family protein n=1 Tax=Dickeya dadantii TaxID=204038 RepID=UPI001CC381EC|nr:PD-(D/E)XK nuclease family protein [Dickeya dadantii]UAY97879.1 PD-(D/E)XK nuclease family protein [Dickeya dadantii]